MSFVLTQPAPGVFLLDFETQAQMGKALMRPQEFAENPKFMDGPFTTSHLKRIYRSNVRPNPKRRSQRVRRNPYTYAVGLNIPGEVLDRFYQTFPALTKAELAVKAALDQQGKPERYYVICSLDRYFARLKRTHRMAGEHELAHALWYTDSQYRQEAQRLLSLVPPDIQDRINRRLRKYGYAEQVLADETHAYLATDPTPKLTERFYWTRLPEALLPAREGMVALLAARILL